MKMIKVKIGNANQVQAAILENCMQLNHVKFQQNYVRKN